MSQNRRSPSRYPPGSSWVGGRICIPRHCANKSPSETVGTLPGSAILCPVSRQCLEPCQQQQQQPGRSAASWFKEEAILGGVASERSSRKRRKKITKKEIKTQRLELMGHAARNDLLQVSAGGLSLWTGQRR